MSLDATILDTFELASADTLRARGAYELGAHTSSDAFELTSAGVHELTSTGGHVRARTRAISDAIEHAHGRVQARSPPTVKAPLLRRAEKVITGLARVLTLVLPDNENTGLALVHY